MSDKFHARRVDGDALNGVITDIGSTIALGAGKAASSGFSGNPIALIKSAGEIANGFATPIAQILSRDLAKKTIGPLVNKTINFIKHANGSMTMTVLRFKEVCKIRKRRGHVTSNTQYRSSRLQ